MRWLSDVMSTCDTSDACEKNSLGARSVRVISDVADSTPLLVALTNKLLSELRIACRI